MKFLDGIHPQIGTSLPLEINFKRSESEILHVSIETSSPLSLFRMKFFRKVYHPINGISGGLPQPYISQSTAIQKADSHSCPLPDQR